LSIPSRATQILAADWVQLLESKLIKTAQVMGFNSLGLWIIAVDDQDRLRAYVLTDISNIGSVSISGNPGVFDTANLATFTGLPGSLTRAPAVRFPSGTTITVGSGSITAIQGAAGASGSGWPVFTDKLDGLNNAYTQTAVGAAAVQLITTGTLYKDLRIKNISATQTIYLGFDNTVSSLSGYVLEKLGPDDEIPFSGWNANLWAIASAAGGNVSIIARG
jgi:hypothetical protein